MSIRDLQKWLVMMTWSMMVYRNLMHVQSWRCDMAVMLLLDARTKVSTYCEIESKLYRILQGGIGILNIRWFVVEGEYNVLVMELLGLSLEDLFNFCSRLLRHFLVK